MLAYFYHFLPPKVIDNLLGRITRGQQKAKVHNRLKRWVSRCKVVSVSGKPMLCRLVLDQQRQEVHIYFSPRKQYLWQISKNGVRMYGHLVFARSPDGEYWIPVYARDPFECKWRLTWQYSA